MEKENQKEAARKKSLGKLGELFAIKALVDKKFDRIRNLNDQSMNETFVDIESEKGDKRYIISVKAAENSVLPILKKPLSIVLTCLSIAEEMPNSLGHTT